MSTIEQSIEVEVPLATVYNQWTQFEEFPAFMEGVEEVRQLDDTHLHWVAELGRSRHEWDAEITEQKPDERVAWRNTDGKENAGVVTFHRLDDSSTRIMVQLDFPRGHQGKARGRSGRAGPARAGRPAALQRDDRSAWLRDRGLARRGEASRRGVIRSA